jgi:hypothetical protein
MRLSTRSQSGTSLPASPTRASVSSRTDKSTVARTVAHRYHGRQRLAASFFFSRGGGDVGHAGKFVTSIAVQLADNITTCRQHIRDAVAERSNIAQQALRDQWQHLVLGPLSKLHEPGPFIIVIDALDALDECDNDNDVQIIVRLLFAAVGNALYLTHLLLAMREETVVYLCPRPLPTPLPG